MIFRTLDNSNKKELLQPLITDFNEVESNIFTLPFRICNLNS
jgi:hypothetical protein